MYVEDWIVLFSFWYERVSLRTFGRAMLPSTGSHFSGVDFVSPPIMRIAAFKFSSTPIEMFLLEKMQEKTNI